MSKTILQGHISPETAYVVEDYPYGFRLRCRIRYWLEYKPAHGVRLVSQTSNPKRGDVWNKPKASTYGRFGGCMYLDDEGHVQWAALTEYVDGKEAVDWQDEYGAGVPEAARADMVKWVGMKIMYDAGRKAGMGMHEAAAKAVIETAKNGSQS